MNMQQMMMQAQKMQRELKKAHDALNTQEFKVSKGGAVTITMLGDRSIKFVEIQEDALEKDNKEMLQDLIAMAFNELLEQINQANDAIDEKITGRAGGLF